MMDDATVLLTVVASRIEADLLVGLLDSHGLWARSAADDAGGQEPQLQLQGVRVLVAREDELRAREILRDVNEPSEPTEPSELREG